MYGIIQLSEHGTDRVVSLCSQTGSRVYFSSAVRLYKDTLGGLLIDCLINRRILRRDAMFIAGLGAIFFGLVVGWIAYRTLRLTVGTNIFAAIAIIVAVVGGAAVTTLLKDDVVFGWYAIGLAIGFFAYFGIGWGLYGKHEL